MKRNDIILILLLIILSLIPLEFNTIGNKKMASIKIDGIITQQIDLNKDSTFIIETINGKNTVKVENKNISIIEADCPDKVCVKTGEIKNINEVIACVPHGLLIQIIGD